MLVAENTDAGARIAPLESGGGQAGPAGVDNRVVVGHTGAVAGGLLVMLGCPSLGSF